MSRHKHMKNLELCDDDDFEDEEDDNEDTAGSSPHGRYQYDRTKATRPLHSFFGPAAAIGADDADLLHVTVPQVYDVVGDDADEDAVVEALRQANYNVAEAIDALLSRGGDCFPAAAVATSAGPAARTATAGSTLASLGAVVVSARGHQAPAATGKPPAKQFAFDTPSPDDVAARSAVAGGAGRKGPKLPPPRKRGGKTDAAQPSSAAAGAAPTAAAAAAATAAGSAGAADSKAVATAAEATDAVLDVPMRSKRAQEGAERLLAELQEEERSTGKERLSLAVVGHVDAGKSTLMGHVLYKLGCVTEKQMRKFVKESREMGKPSFAYAWVMDEQEEERARGVTMDVGVNFFETERKLVTLLDAPGHRDFIPNMISGAVQADVAVLVVPAATGEFESSFQDGSQTREHAVLVRSVGVTQLVVAVNKMDMVQWSRARFEEVVGQLRPFLLKWGYKAENITFLPVSGTSGQNVTERSEPALAWFTGPTLVQAIDGLAPATRPLHKPLRFCVSNVFRTLSLGTAVAGKLETGYVLPGDKLLVMPARMMVTVKSIERGGDPLRMARAGDNVELGLLGVEQAALSIGNVLCPPDSPVPVVFKIAARMQTLPGLTRPVLKGQRLTLHIQSVSEPATITKLQAVLHSETGEVVQKRPRLLTANMTADVEITLDKPLCLELYSDYRRLGRFMLRDAGATVAVGLVTELKQRKARRGKDA